MITSTGPLRMTGAIAVRTLNPDGDLARDGCSQLWLAKLYSSVQYGAKMKCDACTRSRLAYSTIVPAEKEAPANTTLTGVPMDAASPSVMVCCAEPAVDRCI